MAEEAIVDDAGSRFPFIGLKKALERAEELYKQAGDHDVLVTDAFGIWGYSLKSSGGFQSIAALKSYGLIRDAGGGGDKRKIALTEGAVRYFKDERPDHRANLLKSFALAPKLMRALFEYWKGAPPADQIARSHLKVDRELSEQGARAFLGIFKDNLDFAKLTSVDKIPADGGPAGGSDTPPPPPPPPLLPAGRKGLALMEGERELTSGLLSKDASFRLLVSGKVGAKEVERLIKKLELDKEILGDPEENAAPDVN